MFLIIALGVSVIANIILAFKIKPAGRRKMSIEARDLLHDLTNGGAIVRVTVIDPEGLMVYRGIK